MSAGSIPDIHSAPSTISRSKHDHVVHLYENDLSLVGQTARLLRDSLAAGRSVIVVATSGHREAFARELHSCDLASLASSGRYLSLDAEQTLSEFFTGGKLDARSFMDFMTVHILQAGQASASSDPRVTVFGEMVALLWAQGDYQAAIRLEQLWNELGTRHSFSLRCSYPMNSFDKPEHTELFTRICSEHSSVIPEGADDRPLMSEEERLRNIAELQQRLHVLERERAFRESEQRFRLLVEACS